MSHIYRNLCCDQEQLFFKKRNQDKVISPPVFVVFDALCSERYHCKKHLLKQIDFIIFVDANKKTLKSLCVRKEHLN